MGRRCTSRPAPSAASGDAPQSTCSRIACARSEGIRGGWAGRSIRGDGDREGPPRGAQVAAKSLLFRQPHSQTPAVCSRCRHPCTPHLVDGERRRQVAEAAQGRPGARGAKLEQQAPLLLPASTGWVGGVRGDKHAACTCKRQASWVGGGRCRVGRGGVKQGAKRGGRRPRDGGGGDAPGSCRARPARRAAPSCCWRCSRCCRAGAGVGDGTGSEVGKDTPYLPQTDYASASSPPSIAPPLQRNAGRQAHLYCA